MKIGIVGAGAMGQTHAQSWAQIGADIGGVVSHSSVSAKSLATEYNTRAFDSYTALLDAVDVVDLCTPTHTHHAMVLAAAQAGKQIICEKPLARTLAEAREMITVCQEQGVKLLVGHVVRYFPEYVAAQAQVASGAIGQPAVLRLSRGGFRPKPAWFHDQAKAGGIMLDMMIHDFDYARWIAGDVVRVFAKNIGNTQANTKADVPVDHGLAILTHANGAISHVEGSWAYPPPLFRTCFEIAGANGLIEHDSEDVRAIISHRYAQPDTDDADVPLPDSPLLEDPYTTQLHAFYRHLLHDEPLVVTAEDGLKALEIALAALESAETGKVVTL